MSSKPMLSQRLSQLLSNQSNKSPLISDHIKSTSSQNHNEENDSRSSDKKSSKYDLMNSHSFESNMIKIFHPDIKNNPLVNAIEPKNSITKNMQDSNEDILTFYTNKTRNLGDSSNNTCTRNHNESENNNSKDRDELIQSSGGSLKLDDYQIDLKFESIKHIDQISKKSDNSLESNPETKTKNDIKNWNFDSSPTIKVSNPFFLDKNSQYMESALNHPENKHRFNVNLMKNSQFQSPIDKNNNVEIVNTRNTETFSKKIGPEQHGDKIINQMSIKCTKHKDQLITAICIKDYCGDLLCPICMIQHGKLKHMGTYKSIHDFLNGYRMELENHQIYYKNLITKLNHNINKLKSTNDSYNSDDNSNNSIMEILNTIEDSLINIIKQFINDLRIEIGNNLDKNTPLRNLDIDNLLNNLESYEIKLTEHMSNINKDLKSLTLLNQNNPVNINTSIDNDYLLHISNSYKSKHKQILNDIYKQYLEYEQNLQEILENNKHVNDHNLDKNLNDILYIHPDLQKRLQEFLNNHLYLKNKPNQQVYDQQYYNQQQQSYQQQLQPQYISETKPLKTIQEKLSEQGSSSSKSRSNSPRDKNEDVLLYYQNLYNRNDQNNYMSKSGEIKSSSNEFTPSNYYYQSTKNITLLKGTHDEFKHSPRNLTLNISPRIDPKKFPIFCLHSQMPIQKQQSSPKHQNSPKNQQQQVLGSHRANIQKTSQLDLKRAKTISPPKNVKPTTDQGNQVQAQAQGIEKPSKRIISHKAINSQATQYNNVIIVTEQQQQGLLHEKDLDPIKMRIALNSLCEYFQSQKIKVFDSSFVLNLLNLSEISHLDDINSSQIQYENIRDVLSNKNGKSKCIFHYYEKLFFPIYINNQQWILTEIKNNPKTIIIYDPLNKSITRNCYMDNLLNLFQEVIRFDYKDKYNQTPDFINQWEKKISIVPSLVVKNFFDTGIYIVKVISNAFQHKEFSNASISSKEINIIRKKIEKFFKCKDDNHPIEKFLPF